MGIFDFVKSQLIEVIEWLDNSSDTVVWRFPVRGNEIKMGAQLTVREGQFALFINEGRLADVFGPGRYELSTQNMPILTKLMSWKYGFNSPFKAEVYFVSSNSFTDQKWGTPNPITLRDPDFRFVRIGAFGNYAYRVTDPAKFVGEVVGTDGEFTLDEIEGQLKGHVLSSFTQALGQSKVAALDLAGNLGEVASRCRALMTEDFGQWGLELTAFVIQSVNLPQAVREAIDKASSMAALGDMGSYTQYQAANALESAAANPGGLGGMGAQLAAGVGMANAMVGGMAFGGAGAPAAAPPPAPPSGFHYSGGSGSSGPLSAAEIAQRVAADASGRHMVWRAGWSGWQPASQVAEISSLLPPPAPGGGTAVGSFHFSDGAAKQELSGDALLAAIRGATGPCLVWKAGMAGWASPQDVPELAGALGAGGAPTPPPLP